MVQGTPVEPGFIDYAVINSIWWARMGSNHQPTPYEGAALPLSYGPKERATGFGPAMSAWKADALPLGDAREPFF